MRIIGTDAPETWTGTAAQDQIYGNGGADTLLGGGDNDLLVGGRGGDRLDGGDGFDTASYEGSAIGVFVSLITNRGFNGDAEGDRLVSIENLRGSAQQDLLVGNDGANTLYGAHGDDVLDGGGGADILFGRDVGAAAGDGNDTLKGGGGFDMLYGGDGNDKLDGGTDADWMYGEGGDDTYTVDDSGDFVWEWTGAAGGTHDVVQTSVSYSLAAGSAVEVLETTDPDGTAMINLTGNEFGQTITGNNGSNTLDGRGGADVMAGRGGNDTYLVDNSADVVTESVGQGLDWVRASTTYVLAAGSEIELLYALDRSSTTAMDLVGNDFDQDIVGNDGTNTIVGRGGRDVMRGGGAGDVFVWTSLADSGVAGSEADVVTDFNRGEGDQLAVNPIDAIEGGGDDIFTFIGTAGGFTGAGQIRYFTTATDTYILFNTRVDADPMDDQEMTIRLTGVHTVDASWFAL